MSELVLTFAIKAGVGVVGTVIGVAVSPIVREWLATLRGPSFRRNRGIADVLGEYDAEWFCDGKLLHKDVVSLTHWSGTDRVAGKGVGRTKHGYSISLKVYPSRLVRGFYVNNNHPDVGYFGVVMLAIDMTASQLSGRWEGCIDDGHTLGGGEVRMVKRNPSK
jgi:hypothetical protein